MLHYILLADLFKYPSENLHVKNDEALMLIKKDFSSEMPKYTRFSTHIQDHSLRELQEYYVNTFDIQALCYLDIGYVLFGDDLKRGNFLVQLLSEHRKINNDLGTELPDHLPNLLTLLAKTTDTAFRDEFVQYILLPAILTMIKGFKEVSNVYLDLLMVLKEFLKRDFQIEEININIPAKQQNCVLAGNGCHAPSFENIKNQNYE